MLIFNGSGCSPASSAVANASNVDAAGRLEVAMTTSWGDYNHALGLLPDLFDSEVGFGGSVSHSVEHNAAVLDVPAVAGTYAVYQTRQFHPYFPGHPMQPEMTMIDFGPQAGAEKRIGYYSSDTVAPFNSGYDGIYLKSEATGVSLVVTKRDVHTVIAQAQWDAAFTGGIDWDKFQVVAHDFLYLGGASSQLRALFGGLVNKLYRHDNSNVSSTVIMGNPQQPIRAEIRSTGGAASMMFVCANVGVSGGSSDAGYGLPWVVDSGADRLGLNAIGTEYFALGVKKNTRFVEVVPNFVEVTSTGGGGDATHRWNLRIAPVLSGGVPAWGSCNGGRLECAVGNGVITVADGIKIASGSGASKATSAAAIERALRVGVSIAGEFEGLVLSIIPHKTGQKFIPTFSGNIYGG